MKVTNIVWDIDMEDIYKKLDSMLYNEAAEVLGISSDYYANMTTSERHDYAYRLFHDNPEVFAEYMGLPDEAEVSDHVDIEAWLCMEYEWCVKGFSTGKRGSMKPVKVHPIRSESIILWGDDGNEENTLVKGKNCEGSVIGFDKR